MRLNKIRRIILTLTLLFSFLALTFPTATIQTTDASCAPQCLGCEWKKTVCQSEAMMTYLTCQNAGGYEAICYLQYYDIYTACLMRTGCLL